jgi:hypothetical protein
MDNNKVTERRVVSEEVYEQVNSRPPWFIRNGLGSIVLLIIAAVGCAALISYPETVPLKITIEPSEKPIRFVLPDSVSLAAPLPSGYKVLAGEELALGGNQRARGTRTSLRSPTAGTLYVGYDFEHRLSILQIIPDATTYTIWGEVGEGYSGEVVIGMIVRIRLGSEQSTTCTLRGKVTAVSAFPVDHKYAIRISPDGPIADLNKRISSAGGDLDCTGNLEISNASILGRVFVQFFHLKRII